MKTEQDAPSIESKFLKVLQGRPDSPLGVIEQRLLPEYGAVLVARGGAIPPDTLVFLNEDEVSRFQQNVGYKRAQVGEFVLELQPSAMSALLDAIAAAEAAGLTINPRGQDSARRSYRDTEVLWTSRVEPALDHWVKEGRLNLETASEIRALHAFDQIPKVFELETQGLWFAKDLSKSIIYSVAPPGTSQHLSMLAFDVAEYNNIEVRRILAENGWFQTVVSDLPHFTYLGLEESELPSLGLKRIVHDDRHFWVPDI